MPADTEKNAWQKRVEVKSYLLPFTELPRPVFWFHDRFQAGTWSGLHSHDNWGELAFMKAGHMVVCTEQGNFLVPPQRAVWLPAGTAHEWYLPQDAVDCGLFIRPDVFQGLPRFDRLHAMEISPLVRELIYALADMPHEYDEGPVSRMVDVLLDQISAQPVVAQPMVMPRDHRLVELAGRLINEPDSPETIGQWGRRLGLSERTLTRLFQNQTGESFGGWRRRIRLHHARARLEAGENVTSVALGCGYHSVSSFIALFKKAFGRTPGQFLKAGSGE